MQTVKQKQKQATASTLLEFIKENKRGRLTAAQLLRLKIMWKNTARTA